MRLLEREGVVDHDALSFYEIEDAGGELAVVRIAGRLLCPEHGVAMRIDKRMDVRRGLGNRHEVKTVAYQYYAWLRKAPGRTRRDLLRIDNNPPRPKLHAHLFDSLGHEVESPDIERDARPTLDVFIRHVAGAGTV